MIVTVMAAGAKGLTLPDPAQERRNFDVWLSSPLGIERAKERLLTELGVA